MRISVVCVYNNKRMLNNYTLKSLKNQTSKFELIVLDNTKGRYKSAAEALNYGGQKAKGKYIMFAHQDINLCSNTWLNRAEKILDNIPNLGIAGVAGMSANGKINKERGRNIIKHGDPARMWSWGNPIQRPEIVQTVDECLVIIPKSVFNMLQFDEKVCDDWHLYGVDYSLSIKRLGYDAYVIPMFVYHRSSGYSFSDRYYVVLKKILKKHKKHYKRIYTTMGDWKTLYPLSIQKFWRLEKGKVRILLENLKGVKNDQNESFHNNP